MTSHQAHDSDGSQRHTTWARRQSVFRRAGVALCALLTGLAVSLGSASVAPAATPILIGAGTNASVAVDGAGTAFIVYNDNDDDLPEPRAVLHFCRLPRGGAACERRLDIALPGTTLTRPQVFVEGRTVRIFAFRYDVPGPEFTVSYVLTSTDGGSTFGAPIRAGTLVAGEDAVAGPGTDGISVVTEHAGGARYQRVDANKPSPVDSNGRSTLPSANFGGEYPLNSAVGLVNATTPLVTFNALNYTAAFRVFKGSGDVNDAANWSDAQVIAPHGEYGRLAEGPSGLFSQLSAGNPYRLDVRRFDGSTFGAPTSIPISEGAPSSDLAQDPGGMLFSLWPENSGVEGPRLRYASSPDGVSWRRADLAAFAHPVINLRAAAAADHLGYAVMDVSPPEGRQIYAVPLAPAPPPPPLPPPATITPRPSAGAPVPVKVFGFSMTRSTFCVGGRCPSARRGTVLRFGSSVPARVEFLIDRRLTGRRVAGRCRPTTRRNRGSQRCGYYAEAGSFSRAATVGVNSIGFSGRIDGRALRPGTYRLSLTATGASGARSTARIRFRVHPPNPARARGER